MADSNWSILINAGDKDRSQYTKKTKITCPHCETPEALLKGTEPYDFLCGTCGLRLRNEVEYLQKEGTEGRIKRKTAQNKKKNAVT